MNITDFTNSTELTLTPPPIRKRRNQRDINAENTRLLYYFGITIKQYNGLYYKQKGRCAGCNKHQSELKRRLDVDHDHFSKIIRGLLCNRCNRAIGLLDDNPQVFIKLAEYLSTAHLGPRIRSVSRAEIPKQGLQ